MKMQITFRSGGQIEVDVDEFTVGTGPVSGELRELRWVSPATAVRRLKHIDITQVAAVVAIHEPGDSNPAAGEETKADV